MSQNRRKPKPSQKESESPEPSLRYDPSRDERYNKPVINKAFELFLKDYPFERIHAATELPVHIWYKKQKRWKKARERFRERQMKEYMQKSFSKQMKELYHMGATFADRYLRNLLSTPEAVEMKPREFKDLVNAMTDFHRMQRVEDGEANEIVNVYQHLSLKEAREVQVKLSMEMQKEYGEVIDYVDVEAVPIEEQLRLESLNEEN